MSTKALAYADHFAKKGHTLHRLDLRKPSFEKLSLTAMIEHVRDSITGDAAILIGSSLGGLTAARVAERDERVKKLVLLAPAFRIVPRWQQQLGPEWDEWKTTGWREVHDYSKNGPSKISFSFMEDVMTFGTDFPVIKVPTLIVHGTTDDTVPIEYSRELANRYPLDVKLIELEDGHQLTDSIPRLLVETDAFLKL